MNINYTNINNQLHDYYAKISANLVKNYDGAFRSDFYVTTMETFDNPTVKRVAVIALPFIGLYAPARIFLNVSTGAIHTWTILTHIKADSDKADYTYMELYLLSLAAVVGTVALTIFMPVAVPVVTGTCQILHDTKELYKHLAKREWKDAGLTILAITNEAIYVATIFYASSEMLLLSLTLQAIKELYHAYQEFQQEKIPETLANTLMALIRLSQAAPHGRRLHRNHFGKRMTQEDAVEILQQLKKLQETSQNGRPFDFETFLIDRHISNKIENIDFTVALQTVETSLYRVKFHEMQFTDCKFFYSNFSYAQFSWVVAKKCDFSYSDFGTSIVSNCTFNESNLDGCSFAYATVVQTVWNNCAFSSASFYNTALASCQFKACNLTDNVYVGGDLRDVRFLDSNLTNSSFNSADLKKVLFQKCALIEACFLDAVATETAIENCDLTNCLFVGTEHRFKQIGNTPNIFTKVVIAHWWDFIMQGPMNTSTYLALKDCNAIPLRFESNPKGIDLKAFDAEMETALAKYANGNLPEGAKSIPDAMLREAIPGSVIAQYRERAERIAAYSQGLILTGGNGDINPAFYNQPNGEHTSPDTHHNRIMAEFAAVSKSYGQGMPILGICRGAQVVNIFFGGTLNQHVEDHFNVTHDLKIKQDVPSNVLDNTKSIFGESLLGLSMHHQANDKIGEGLHVVLEEGGVPKLLMSADGQIVVTQFHPEIYVQTERTVQTAIRLDKLSRESKKGQILAQQQWKYWPTRVEDIPALRENSIKLKNFFTTFLDKAERVPL